MIYGGCPLCPLYSLLISTDYTINFFSGRTSAPGGLYRHGHTGRSHQSQSTQPNIQDAVCSAGGDVNRHGKQEVCNIEVVRYGQQHTNNRHGSTPVSTVLRKSVTFFIIYCILGSQWG